MKTLNQGRSVNLRGFRRWLVVSLLFFATLFAGTLLKAATITLAFDAQVSRIFRSPFSDFDIPFPVALGDTIHGRFTFEPSPLGHLGTQDTGLRFDVGKVVLESPTYDIYAALHQASTRLPLEFFDVTDVTCSLLSSRAQCEPGTVPGASSVEWRPFLSLGAKSPLLEPNDLPGDVGIWNAFTARGLTLSFTPVEGDGLVEVGGIVGPFVVVPEPTTCELSGAVGMMALFLLRPKCLKADQLNYCNISRITDVPILRRFCYIAT